MMKPIITTLAFESLDRNKAVLAGRGVVSSTNLINDSKYIVIPVALRKDIFIYYAFDDKSPQLYRLKRGDSKRDYDVNRSTCRDIKELLMN